MLIISKIHDFYDTVAKQKGIDKTIVYKREQTVAKIDKYLYNWRNSESNYFPHYELFGLSKGLYKFDPFLIGFCGKIYPLMVTYTRVKRSFSFFNTDVIKEYIYDVEIMRELDKKYHKYKPFDNFIALTKSKDILDLFFKYTTPCFLLTNYGNDHNFEINPCLKDIEFFRVMDPVTAFQELEMYISQQLCTEKETIIISDKDKIMGHGFDYKYSFRKDKK